MTQTTLEVAPAVETSSSSSRNLLLVGGLVAVLALGGGGYVLLSGGSPDLATGPVPTHHKPLVRTVAAKKVTPSKQQTTVVPAVSTVPVGRDPFHALYIAAPATSASAQGSSATGTSGSSTTIPGSTAPVATAPYVLTLVRVTGGTNGTAPIFTWNVGGTSKQVLAAQKFGKYGELVTLTYVKSSTNKVLGAVVQVGDDEPIAVKLGEKITVK
jgi:hypothetical protein